MAHKVHEGRNVKWFRELRQVKQDALAADLGDDWSQKKVSLLEQKETIEPAILEQISKILDIPVEAFQKLDDEQVVNIISNTFNDQSNGYNYYPTFNINPIEKWMEALEENKKLYERMLASEREKVELMKAMLGKLK